MAGSSRSIRSFLLTCCLLLSILCPFQLWVSASSPVNLASSRTKRDGGGSSSPRQPDHAPSNPDRGQWKWQRLPSEGSADDFESSEKAEKQKTSKSAPKSRAFPRNPFVNRSREDTSPPSTPAPAKDGKGDIEAPPVDPTKSASTHNVTTTSDSENQTSLPPADTQPNSNLSTIFSTASTVARPYSGYPPSYGSPPASNRGAPSGPTAQSSLLIIELANLLDTLATRLWFIPLVAVGWQDKAKSYSRPSTFPGNASMIGKRRTVLLCAEAFSLHRLVFPWQDRRSRS